MRMNHRSPSLFLIGWKIFGGKLFFSHIVCRGFSVFRFLMFSFFCFFFSFFLPPLSPHFRLLHYDRSFLLSFLLLFHHVKRRNYNFHLLIWVSCLIDCKKKKIRGPMKIILVGLLHEKKNKKKKRKSNLKNKKKHSCY